MTGNSGSNVLAVHEVNRAIITSCILGILLSTYALYIKMAAEFDPKYKALCDLAEHISCSKTLTSRYSQGLGLFNIQMLKGPNSVFGIIFYCVVTYLCTFNDVLAVQLQLGLALLSAATCLYLPYLIIFHLRQFCIVSFSIFCIKIAIVIFSLNKIYMLRDKIKLM